MEDELDATTKGDVDDEQASTASLKSNSVHDILADEDEEDKPIDDDEFNIPPVDFEPTLESILNDVDNQSLSEDEVGHHESGTTQQPQLVLEQIGLTPDGSDTVSIVSRGSGGDNRSRTSSRSMRNNKTHPQNKRKPSSILRHVLLKGMTSSLASASEKIDSGTATAVAMGNLITVGTSHGYVLVFDSIQNFKWCLGESHFREEGGSVSSLAVSGNGARLLVGFAKGLILMYDLENGKLLSDSGGSVFELCFKRTMGVRGCDSRCIFSGSRGEVCTFEPVLLAGYADNPLKKFVIVALATLSKVLVVVLRPKLKVIFTHPLASDPTTLPIVQWQMVIIQTSQNEKIVDPVLTFARDNMIYFYQMTLGAKNNIELLPLQKVNIGYQLIGLHWLNSRTIALLDTRETLHVLDVRSQEELEIIDLSQVHLVYANSHFKGLATGGNVSRAFALAGERACYNSVLCFNNQIVLLGTRSVHALTMRSWHERLDYLVKQNFYTEALQLGYELYLEKAKAIIGLKGNKDSKKLIVREKLLYILERFVDLISSLNYLEDLNTAMQNYKETIYCAVNYYVRLDCRDPIFAKLYDICQCNPLSSTAYLESLEPFILNDQLRAVPPGIVKDLFVHLEELGKYQACHMIFHLNVESLDIHQTMKICWTQGLYDAIIYIFNDGMKDYIEPFESLMTELQSALEAETELTNGQISLGNKILVYASCCLTGRAYPYGDIPIDLVEKVHSDIFRCITTLHTRNSSESEVAYPYLRCLLKFDTREFLNVLSLSFEEAIFQTELGKRQKQRMVDILLQVMVEQGNFTPTQVGILFTFLARQMAKPDSSLYVSKLLFEQVLEHLTSAKEGNRVDERQQALIELLQAGGIQHFDYNKLLDKCLHAKFYRVCEMLYERRQEYSKIIECYLLDAGRSGQVFSYIHKMFCLFPNKKGEFQQSIKHHLEEMIDIDNKKTAQLVYLHSTSTMPELVKSLENRPEKQYLFLQGAFAMRDQNQGGIHVDTVTTERYIELMCRFSPQLVYPFLKSAESYRNEQVMDICKKYKLIEAIGYLLEKDGQLFQAFELMKDQFKEKLNTILDIIDNNPNATADEDAAITSIIQWTQLQALFVVIIQFSQRNSQKLVAEKREELWLPLLELVIGAYNKFQKRSKICSAFNDMAKHLLSSMMGHVSLPTIVEIVMNDPSYQKATFAEVRDLVMGMLETCTYEDTMVNLVKQVTQSDLHGKLASQLRYSKKGFSPKGKSCFSCHMPLNSTSSDKEDIDVVVFHCGHSIHHQCAIEHELTNCSLCQSNQDRPSSSGPAKDITFNIPNKSAHFEFESSASENGHQFLSHSEFELQLEAKFKLSLEEF
ncbi:Vacuolar protein sorting-associated protein 8 [Folsomia candida]|uniref:Vacuolar protein sorting-associated protein 8 n=1 Tax=Folsomia candida TaxID=158441 RepID=A0A226EZV8_FOLCA|nr:Vacuolar protein sorting-associated protein 8 [Folsomia candida]